MYIRVGYGKKVKNDIWMGTMHCPRCGQMTDFRLKKIQLYGRIFGIPVVSRTVGRGIACERCGAYLEKTRQEYGMLKKQQMQSLAEGAFPDRIVSVDYAPEHLHAGRKIGLFIVALLFALLMIFMVAVMVTEIRNEGGVLDGGSIAAIFLILCIAVLPLLFSFRSCLRVRKLEKIYRSYAERYQWRRDTGGFSR